MLLRLPHFYPQFHCIADKCTDTCCVGWEIDIDDKTQNKYRNLYRNGKEDDCRQQFLQKLLSNIEDGHFKLLPGDRCPFLRGNGLCEMICEMGCNGTDIGPDGESILCDICREHPRFVEVYGDIMEKGLGLCCEEAARLLLSCGPLSFIESEVDDDPDEMPEGAEEARDAIFQEREVIFGMLNNKSIPLKQRLTEVLNFAVSMSDCDESESEDANLSNEVATQAWIKILGEGESYGPAWDTAYERMVRCGWQQISSRQTNCDSGLFSEDDGANIISYLVFRYYAKSLFDGDNLTKVQFAIYFWIILEHFGDILGTINPDGSIIESGLDSQTIKINAIKLLSKQTEYSEEVMEILADNFFDNPDFSVEHFRRILSQM